MAKKKETWPKSMMGKNCGYQLHEDGSITIAPAHANVMEEARQKREALDEFLASITRVSQKLSDEVATLQRRFWDDVANDYGLDLKDGWTFHFGDRRLAKKPPSPVSEPGEST